MLTSGAMARKRRGWGGDPPDTDDEATRRIITAAVDLIARTGSTITIADVAESLGVIRQTVYRYFPTADELMRAAAIYAERFSDSDGRLRATFEVLWVSGWVPHESQQKPLRPGTAQTRLAEALGTAEHRLTPDTGDKP